MGRRGWVSVLTVNHCSAHNLQPKRYLPSKLTSLVHSRMRQSTTSSNMVVLGNIWEQTAETSVWLAVVRKWSGSFLATAHLYFGGRDINNGRLSKSSCSHKSPNKLHMCTQEGFLYHIGLLSHTQGLAQSLSVVSSLNTMPNNAFPRYPTRLHVSEGGKRNEVGLLTPAGHLRDCLLTPTEAEQRFHPWTGKIFLSVNRK